MASALGTLTEFFFGGDSEAARCLFEGGREEALHVKGGALKNPLLSVDWWTHIATLLDNHDVGPFEFDVIQGGNALPAQALLDAKSRPSRDAITRAVNQGSTLRVYGVSRFEPNCASQLQLLRHVLKREAFVNLYLTPAQSPGLKVHYDLEDSIVVQVKGEKHWKVYGPDAGPRFPRELPPGQLVVRGEPAQLVHMRAGDVLFVPSGIPHTVDTQHTSSQHVTFGVQVSRPASLLSEMLDQFAASQDELRRPLRSGEEVSRDQLVAWASSFERWLRNR